MGGYNHGLGGAATKPPCTSLALCTQASFELSESLGACFSWFVDLSSGFASAASAALSSPSGVMTVFGSFPALSLAVDGSEWGVSVSEAPLSGLSFC